MKRSLLAAAVLAFAVSPAAAQTFKTELHEVTVETVAAGFAHPWGLAFLPDGSMLVTERDGDLNLVGANGKTTKVAGVPRVWAGGQGGLLDVAADPDFARNRTIFLSYSEPSADGDDAGTAVARARIVLSQTPRLQKVRVIFSMKRKSGGGRHFGSRIVISPDKKLFITTGDRGQRERAQDPMDHAGKVLRINRDGSIPADNPFADGAKGLPEIWSIGHRNAQGAIWNPRTRSLWTVAHGARGGDEINRPEAGKNYGWPVISYGKHYWGGSIGEGTAKPGMEQPVYFWDPSIAPSGMAFYTGDAFPRWKGNIFVGALKFQLLARLEVEDGKVVKEERLFGREFGRIRDVRQGPDGFLYLLTDEGNGKLLRVRPPGAA